MENQSFNKNEKLQKVKVLRDRGIEPYPQNSNREISNTTIKKDFLKLSKRKKKVYSVGRVRAIREHGGAIFADIDDGTDILQIYIKKNIIGEDLFKLFEEVVDAGDFIEVGGKLFVTKKKEKTIEVHVWRMLSKCIQNLPDKWHGLQDIEERFRKRYLDILMNADVKDRFIKRTEIITEVRNYLNKDGYLEVDTPALQLIAGGATARPFVTHHNALDLDMYLRVAPELFLKELLVAGFDKIYELGRSFRNEGIDITHNPEFTSLEVYTAYSTPEAERERIEKLFITLVKKICGSRVIEYDGNKIEFKKHFNVVTFVNLFKQHALIAENQLDDREEISLRAKQFGITVHEHDSTDNILDNIYKKICRPRIVEPTFVIDYPASFSPLAKRNSEKKWLIDRFQLIIGGLELVNGFAELNDPVEQRDRFKEQEERRTKGDMEAQPSDESFIEAMEYAMPPATGWAIGIERLVMLLTNMKNIREVILFPTLRPKKDE